jgi:hypothetical protein
LALTINKPDCQDNQKNGAAEGTRTPDPIITNDVLYQLSYSGPLLGAAIQGWAGRGKMENVEG